MLALGFVRALERWAGVGAFFRGDRGLLRASVLCGVRSARGRQLGTIALRRWRLGVSVALAPADLRDASGPAVAIPLCPLAFLAAVRNARATIVFDIRHSAERDSVISNERGPRSGTTLMSLGKRYAFQSSQSVGVYGRRSVDSLGRTQAR